jgi:hypothetical protein
MTNCSPFGVTEYLDPGMNLAIFTVFEVTNEPPREARYVISDLPRSKT